MGQLRDDGDFGLSSYVSEYSSSFIVEGEDARVKWSRIVEPSDGFLC